MAGLVIVFAVPAIFLLPWLVEVFGLSATVAGAWIGGNRLFPDEGVGRPGASVRR